MNAIKMGKSKHTLYQSSEIYQMLRRVTLMATIILLINSICLHLFPILLKNAPLLFQVLAASGLVLFTWRGIRNEGDRTHTCDITLLRGLCILLIVYSIPCMIWKFYFLVFKQNEDLLQDYTTGSDSYYYLLMIIFTLYSIINLLFPFSLFVYLHRLKEILKEEEMMYSRASNQSSFSIQDPSSIHVERLDLEPAHK